MTLDKIPRWSRPIVRLSLSAGLIVAAWLLATCGGPPRGTAAGSQVLVEYRRTGGIAGLDDHLVIASDGQATLARKGGQRETFAVEKDTLANLREILDEVGFFELEDEYRPERLIPDALSYQITYQQGGRRHTVETTDGSIPEEVMPILDELNQIIAEH